MTRSDISDNETTPHAWSAPFLLIGFVMGRERHESMTKFDPLGFDRKAYMYIFFLRKDNTYDCIVTDIDHYTKEPDKYKEYIGCPVAIANPLAAVYTREL